MFRRISMKKALTYEEEVKKMRAYADLLASNPKKSDKFLVRTGIHTCSGKLSPQYKNLVK